jgi:hypothetical protein
MTPFKQPLEAVVDTENRLYGLPSAEPMRRGAAPAALDCVQLLAGALRPVGHRQ